MTMTTNDSYRSVPVTELLPYIEKGLANIEARREELLQETFVRAYRRLGTIQGSTRKVQQTAPFLVSYQGSEEDLDDRGSSHVHAKGTA